MTKDNKPIIVTTAIAILAKFKINTKVHSEDVSVKLWEYDPKRFGMVTKNFPDAQSYDRDFARARTYGWIYGSRHREEYLDKDGFFLTQKGYEIAIENKKLFSQNKENYEKDINEKATIKEIKKKIDKFKSFQLYQDYELAITNKTLEDFFKKLEDKSTIFFIAEMLSTSVDNLERLNRLFDELKLSAGLHEKDKSLIIFLEKIEQNFPKYLNKDILVHFHSYKNKAMARLKK